MAEGILKSHDPLSYYVNTVSDLDQKLVAAFKSKDLQRIEEIISEGQPFTYDVFIGTDGGHAFVILAPFEDSKPSIGPDMGDDPFKIPKGLLCWHIDLRYENQSIRTYKISKKLKLIEDILASTKKSFHIGRYEKVKSLKCFDLACLRAAPSHYNAIINDCVEFAKEFCLSLLSYCENSKVLGKHVEAAVKKVSATGLSLEKASRNSFLSGILGNFSLGGFDVSSFVSGPYGAIITVAIILFALLYPIFIAFVVVFVLKWYGL